VDFAIGSVTVTGTDGRARPAARGQELQSGDRIVTTNGRAQIRFTDGAFVSLQPNTDFAIRDYRYEGKAPITASEACSACSGARTVTGAIGRRIAARIRSRRRRLRSGSAAPAIHQVLTTARRELRVSGGRSRTKARA
jgi:hypothetical protein